MKPSQFVDIYDDESSGDRLEWKWDEDAKAFVATDAHMRTYTLTPTHAVLEIEASDEESEDEYE